MLTQHNKIIIVINISNYFLAQNPLKCYFFLCDLIFFSLIAVFNILLNLFAADN